MCVEMPSTRVHSTILKRNSKHVFPCQYCKYFKKTYFGEHLRTASSIIFSQDVFTLCQQYWGRGSGDGAFCKITSCYFRKKAYRMFEMCFKWFWIRLCITWKYKQSFKQKKNVLHTKITTSTSTIKIVF